MAYTQNNSKVKWKIESANEIMGKNLMKFIFKGMFCLGLKYTLKYKLHYKNLQCVNLAPSSSKTLNTVILPDWTLKE